MARHELRIVFLIVPVLSMGLFLLLLQRWERRHGRAWGRV
jgi:hypothetical protein